MLIYVVWGVRKVEDYHQAFHMREKDEIAICRICLWEELSFFRENEKLCFGHIHYVMPVCFPSGDVTYLVGYEVRVHRNFLGLIQI